jgi:hypothetical protein
MRIAGPGYGGQMDAQPLFTISHVSNGYILVVVLPPAPYRNISNEDIEALRSLSGKDPLLEKLQGKEEPLPTPIETKVKDLKIENIYIFKTIKEVTAYINYMMQ